MHRKRALLSKRSLRKNRVLPCAKDRRSYKYQQGDSVDVSKDGWHIKILDETWVVDVLATIQKPLVDAGEGEKHDATGD